ncbi:MAG: PEP-CTERM sorting domain-containing protein [Methanoregulaceae archaeon]|nr:PEP-CTERM sorting domain-containing protein [Methanoregulaceae archaeon]
MRTYLWTLAAMAVFLGVNAVGLAQGMNTSSTLLPPPGVYVAPNDYHMYSAMGIVLDDPAHRPFTQDVIRESMGTDEIEHFGSNFTATEIGLGLGPIVLNGPVSVRTTNRMLSDTGSFQTEILSMSLTGNTPFGPVMIRESPTRASGGRTDITDIGGGMYHIDSFFDVFTELSIDGGQTWVPSDTSTHMYLVPEPATLLLLALGGVAVMRRRRVG